MSEVSKLQVYSLGIVAANKPLSSPRIEVTPIEDAPMIDGALTDHQETLSAKGTTADGTAFESEVNSTLSVNAEWLPLGNSNRMTAPDVRRGETVVLYRFADQDKFWWTTLHVDMKLRKLETVIWGISATRDEKAVPSAENMYFIEWSSHQKHIHLHTSKADGEPYAYDIQINTKDGFIVIQDDIGNSISLNSSEHQLRLINTEGTEVDLNKGHLRLIAPESITNETKDYRVKTNTITIEAATSAALSAPTNLVKAKTTQQGDLGLMGNFGQVGGAGGGSTTASFAGSVKANEDVIAGGVSLMHHTHGNGPTPN